MVCHGARYEGVLAAACLSALNAGTLDWGLWLSALRLWSLGIMLSRSAWPLAACECVGLPLAARHMCATRASAQHYGFIQDGEPTRTGFGPTSASPCRHAAISFHVGRCRSRVCCPPPFAGHGCLLDERLARLDLFGCRRKRWLRRHILLLQRIILCLHLTNRLLQRELVLLLCWQRGGGDHVLGLGDRGQRNARAISQLGLPCEQSIERLKAFDRPRFVEEHLKFRLHATVGE